VQEKGDGTTRYIQRVVAYSVGTAYALHSHECESAEVLERPQKEHAHQQRTGILDGEAVWTCRPIPPASHLLFCFFLTWAYSWSNVISVHTWLSGTKVLWVLALDKLLSEEGREQ